MAHCRRYECRTQGWHCARGHRLGSVREALPDVFLLKLSQAVREFDSEFDDEVPPLVNVVGVGHTFSGDCLTVPGTVGGGGGWE